MLEWWNRVLEIEGARWIIFPSIMIAIVLIAYYVLMLVRNLAIGGDSTDGDDLDSFRKMRDEGIIAAEEYTKVAGLVRLAETETKSPPTTDSHAGAEHDDLEDGQDHPIVKPAPLTLKEAEALKAARNNLTSDGKESTPPGAEESLES